jgi:poly(A) polymerase
VVGGAVRDLLLKRQPKDFDIATDATPEEVRRVFRRARIIGRRFRLVHVMFGDETVEVSTFRRMIDAVDAQTDDHGRLLRDNEFGDQEQDAARASTANALFYDPPPRKFSTSTTAMPISAPICCA